MVDNKSIKSYLLNLFDVKEWSHLQYDTYKLLKQFVNNLSEENRIYELRDDKNIIRNNFKEQPWFIHSKSKPIISQLLDKMTLRSYVYEHNECCLNLHVILSFGSFQLNGCLYKNYINQYINYYIFVENEKHQKAYITYYTQPKLSEQVKNLKLPEFNNIYYIVNLSQTIIYQCDLLNFFSEIMMYYDDSGLLGDLPIDNGHAITLNQLVDKSNQFMLQQKDAINFQIL